MQVSQPHILLLPREILNDILVAVMRTRFEFSADGRLTIFSRALRLRLVCKLFDALCKPALFETRVLDYYKPCLYEWHSISFLKHWPIRRNYGVQKLLHSYLCYRVLNESDPTIHRYVEVRRIAESLCRETGADLEDTVNALCWLGLGLMVGRSWERKDEGYVCSPDATLLSAAAFLGHVPLVTRLLEDGNDPTHTEDILPSAIEAAGRAGQARVLQLLQESLPDVVEHKPNQPFLTHHALSDINHKGKADIQGVYGAAINGDMDILEMALYPPSRADKESTAYFNYMPGGSTFLRAQLEVKQSLIKVTSCARNWAVYSRLTSFLNEIPDGLRAVHMRRYAEYGNYDMVQRLLDSGYHVDGEANAPQGHKESPLYLAARFGNDNIVNLLLERGADIHKARYIELRPLVGAVKSGSIAIVRKLLEYGATCDHFTLVTAALSEYEVMVEFLLDQYTEDCLHAGLGIDLAEETSGYGLTSMVDLLYKRGCFRYVDGKMEAVSPAIDGEECELCGDLHK